MTQMTRKQSHFRFLNIKSVTRKNNGTECAQHMFVVNEFTIIAFLPRSDVVLCTLIEKQTSCQRH